MKQRAGGMPFQKAERPDFRPANPLRTHFQFIPQLCGSSSAGAAPQTYASKPTHRTLHFCTVNTTTLPETPSPASHQYWLQKGKGWHRWHLRIFCEDLRAKRAGKNLAEEEMEGMFQRR
jgi:hypothetical protein